MCGAACVALNANDRGQTLTRAPWLFQLGRLGGYATLGALAAGSLQGLGWLTVQSAALRPVWSFFHVVCIVLGLSLALLGRQPIWLDTAGRGVWKLARSALQRGTLAGPLIMGGLWALLPCGLLYSALLLASLTSAPLQGAAVMALFAAGSSVALLLTPWAWQKLRGHPGAQGWGLRLTGLALAGVSGWALWMGLVHNTAPWCIASPAV